jgi:hypothetical protein
MFIFYHCLLAGVMAPDIPVSHLWQNFPIYTAMCVLMLLKSIQQSLYMYIVTLSEHLQYSQNKINS